MLLRSNLHQKQPSRGVLRKRCSESMQQIYRRAPLLECDFNKVAEGTLLKLHFGMGVLLLLHDWYGWLVYILASSHPRILTFLYPCLYSCILGFLYPYVRVYLLVSSHPYILIFSGACALTCIPASSYRQVILGYSHPHILKLMYSGCLLVISHSHILIFLTFIYSRWLLVFLDPHILIFLGSCTPGVCWYPRIL